MWGSKNPLVDETPPIYAPLMKPHVAQHLRALEAAMRDERSLGALDPMHMNSDAQLASIYMKPRTVPHPIRLYERQLDELRILSSAFELSINQMIRTAIDEYIERKTKEDDGPTP